MREFGVGFSVTQGYSLSASDTASIPYGHTLELFADPGFNQYDFQVWWNPIVGGDYQIGTGQAFQYDGIIHFVTFLVD